MREREKGREKERERERNDNPFGGHNAEPGTVKLTRQEIRPTNRPLSLLVSPLFLRLFSRGPSPALLVAPLPRGELTPGYMQTAIVPSGLVINLLNYITRTRAARARLPVHLIFLLLFVPALCSSLVHLSVFFFPLPFFASCVSSCVFL